MNPALLVKFVSRDNGILFAAVASYLFKMVVQDIEIINQKSFKQLKARLSRKYFNTHFNEVKDWSNLGQIQQETIVNIINQRVDIFYKQHLIPAE